MNEIHISLIAEKITEFFTIPVTNTLVTSIVVSVCLIITALFMQKRLSLIPGRTQVFFETIVSAILDYSEETLGNRRFALKYFPLLATLFLFIFSSNMLEFLPGVGSIGFFHMNGMTHEFIPLFRSVNTDLNVTLALAIIVFCIIEASGFIFSGIRAYGRRFLNFHSVIGFFMGIIELFSEVARLVSFSFRLFGNIFAGEVLIAVIIFFIPFVAPVPLMLFEVFVGFIQAAIFSLLTLFFIKIAISESHA